MWIVLLLMDNSFIYKKSRNCLTTTTKRMWSFWEEQKPLKHLWTRMLAVQAAWAAAAQAVLAGGMIRQYWCLYWLVLLQVLKMMLHVLVCIGSCIGLYLSLYWYWNVLGSYWWMYWHCRLPRQCWQGAWFDSTDACIGCTIASIENDVACLGLYWCLYWTCYWSVFELELICIGMYWDLYWHQYWHISDVPVFSIHLMVLYLVNARNRADSIEQSRFPPLLGELCLVSSPRAGRLFKWAII